MRASSKYERALADEQILNLHEQYPIRVTLGKECISVNEKTTMCHKCRLATPSKFDPFAAQSRCTGCITKAITKTEAKKQYKLTDADLTRLDYTRLYRTTTTIYPLQDVIALALQKYGHTSFKSLLDQFNRPKFNNAARFINRFHREFKERRRQ